MIIITIVIVEIIMRIIVIIIIMIIMIIVIVIIMIMIVIITVRDCAVAHPRGQRCFSALAATYCTSPDSAKRPVDFHWNCPMDVQWYFPMECHFCDFWCAIFCSAKRSSPSAMPAELGRGNSQRV